MWLGQGGSPYRSAHHSPQMSWSRIISAKCCSVIEVFPWRGCRLFLMIDLTSLGGMMLRFGRPTAQCKINLGTEIRRWHKKKESSGNKVTGIDDIPEDWKLENGKKGWNLYSSSDSLKKGSIFHCSRLLVLVAMLIWYTITSWSKQISPWPRKG